MKIKLIVIGKTAEKYLQEGMDIYLKRLVHYTDFQLEVINQVKQTDSNVLREQEGHLLLKKIRPQDYLILLDEKGKQFTSVAFSKLLEKWMVSGVDSPVFVIGGAFGFSPAVYERANLKISLSEMTFSHQMVRLIFLEQLYRGFSIIKKEPYHHE